MMNNMLEMMKPMLTMVEQATGDIKPENEVSEFVLDNYPKLLKQPEALLLVKMIVNDCNDKPDEYISDMLGFYESFRIFYKAYAVDKE